MKNQSTPTINQFVGLVKTNPFENSLEAIEQLAGSIVNDLNLNEERNLLIFRIKKISGKNYYLKLMLIF